MNKSAFEKQKKIVAHSCFFSLIVMDTGIASKPSDSSKTESSFLPVVLKTLAAGPFFIGWLAPLLMTSPGSLEFRTATRSLVITLAYIFLMGVNEFFSFVNLFGYGSHEDKGFSLTVFAFLIVSFIQLIQIFQGKGPLWPDHKLFKRFPGEK